MKERKSSLSYLGNKRKMFILISMVFAFPFMHVCFGRTEAEVKKFEMPTNIVSNVEEEFGPSEVIQNTYSSSYIDVVEEEDYNKEKTDEEMEQKSETKEADNDEESHAIVDEKPLFPGGEAELIKYLSKNVKYPKKAYRKRIQGRVLVSFVVNKDGEITDVKVVRSVDTSLDAEAVRVVKSMPKWKPGKKNGKLVRTRFTLPINFKLCRQS